MLKMQLCIRIAALFMIPSLAIASDGAAKPGEARILAHKAGIYGYPLLVMDMTSRVMSSQAAASGNAAFNHFNHVRAFPDASFTSVVSPNVDTLYSMAWLHLENSPVVLTVPEMGDRYYIMQFLDAWTDVFASIGSRTTGKGAGKFVIAGPGWKGETPGDAIRIDSPTNLAWLIGRTQTNGRDDYDFVHAIQDKYGLEPLHPGHDRLPADDDGAPSDPSPPEQVKRMDAAAFFSRLNLLMRDNPPRDADAPLLAEIQRIGVEPGKTFPSKRFSPEVHLAIEDGLKQALDEIDIRSESPGVRHGPWLILPETVARFGADYPLRAKVARLGLGANLWDDAVYPSAYNDDRGVPLNGANNYTVHFAAGNLPPVNAFWSLTLYNERQYFTDNPLDRYALGDRDPLVFNPDGSLTLYIQHASPGRELEPNWLPAPDAPFSLFLRLYWPGTEVLEDTWPLPALTKAD